MQSRTKKIKFMTLLLLPLLLMSFGVCAENTLPAKDKAILEQAGVPLYPGLQFVNGELQGEMGVRFATADAVEKVREFYRKAFPGWALNDKYGSWILYNGEPGGGPMAYMSKNQVMVAENENLTAWFGVPENMKTEVIIALPEVAN